MGTKKLNDYQKMQVRVVVADKLGFDTEDVVDISDLRNELGMDSLDSIELIMEFEKIFNCDITDADAEKVNTVSDIYKCLEKIMYSTNPTE